MCEVVIGWQLDTHKGVPCRLDTIHGEHAASDGARPVCKRVPNFLFDIQPGVLDSLATWSPGDRARSKAGMEEGQGRSMGRVLESARCAQGGCEDSRSKRAGKGTHGALYNEVELAPGDGTYTPVLEARDPVTTSR